MKMLKIILVFLCIFIFACPSKSIDNGISNLDWKVYSNKEAGLKIEFPCKPIENVDKAQETPRPIYIFGFSCEYKELTFIVQSQHYLDDFNEETIAKSFEAVESGHKMFWKNMTEVKREKIDKFEDSKAILYVLESDNGAKIYDLAVANEIREYSIIVGFQAEDNRKEITTSEFEKISERFRNSFEIIK